jgi:mono/diheme cytochrome c family protein
MRHLIFAATIALIASPALAQQGGDAKNGEKHFLSDGCYQCHGYAGQGATQTGPRISRTALTFDQFLNQLRHPANAMAPYEEPIMPEKTAADIYAYLKAMPEPPDPKSLQLLYVTKSK